ncbi:MAG: hypothetical protein PHW01_01745 [Patescibacteria group bacterium]|nr:hypothetical protein [Patescibacteria group bacterium]
MTNFPQNLNTLLSSRETASRLAKIGDAFRLSEKDRRLQARILGKLASGEIKNSDLPRVLRINLNLPLEESVDLSRAIEKVINIPSEQKKQALDREVPVPPEGLPESKTAAEKSTLLKLGAGAIRDFVDSVLSDLKLKLSPLQKSRLEGSILIYIKDIRDELETEDALTRPEERGGAGLSQAEAAQITQLLKEEFPEEGQADFLSKYQNSQKNNSQQDVDFRAREEETKSSVLEEKEAPPSPAKNLAWEESPIFPVVPPDVQGFPVDKIFTPLDSKHLIESAPLQDKKDISRIEAPAPIFGQSSREVSAAPSPSGSLRQPATLERQRGESVSEASRGSDVPSPMFSLPEGKKTVVTDVLRKLESHSAAGEKQNAGLAIEAIKSVNDLKNLGLENFKIRQPSEASSRLVAQVNSLVGKSELARFQSIEAWRGSGPYKLYIMIGGESIAQGKTITEIAKRRMMQGEPYLTEEEFNAIADASRKFQY